MAAIGVFQPARFEALYGVISAVVSASATQGAAGEWYMAVEREREALTAQSAEPGDDSAHWEDEETKAKHAAFSAKRHRHYGNEAQALKLGAALAQDEEQE